MTTASGPDGSTFSFPDGTPESVVRATLAKHYGWSDRSTDGGVSPGGSAPAMAKWQLPGPDGGLYEVDAPDAQSAYNALHSPSARAAWQGSTGKAGPAPVEDKGGLTVDNVIRSLANGATFGLADRFAAGMGALTGIDGKFGDYEGNLAAQRDRTGAYREAHPVLNAAGNIAGGVGSAVAAAPLLAGSAPAAVAPEAATTAPLLGKIATGAGIGAGLGGVQGAADSPDWTNLPQTFRDAASGAGVGAGFGVAVPIAAKGIGAGAGALADALRGYEGGISRTAGNELVKGLRASAPGEVEGALGRLGPDAMLADSSPAMLARVSGAASNSPAARNIVDAALKAREAGTATRLEADTTRNFGQMVPARMATADVLERRSAQDAQNYGAALDGEAGSLSVDATPVVRLIDEDLKTAVGEQKKALLRLRDEIHEPNPALQDSALNPELVAANLSHDAPTMAKKPPTLVNFIQGAGGMRDTNGDLKSLGLNRFPGLVTNKGLDLDLMREMAHEAGYLGDGTSNSIHETTVQDLLDQLGNHPTYSAHDQDMLDAWHLANDARTGGDGTRMSAAEYRAMVADHHGIGDAAKLPATVPTSNARKLHNLKMELDNVIEHDQPGLGVQAGALKNQNRSLTMARHAINDALEKQVPGYADANALSAPLARKAEAIKLGTTLLNKGPDALMPQELAARLRGMDASGPEERAGLQIGMRSEMGRRFGQTPNDLTAGKAIAGGFDDFNPENIAHVFDPAKASDFVSSVVREKQFADSHNRLLGNSFTEPRQAAAKDMAPKEIGIPASAGHAVAGAARKLMSPLARALLPDVTAAYPEVARIGTAQGAQRDAYVKALMGNHHAKSASDAAAAAAGKRAALAVALTANTARPGQAPRRSQETR